MLRFQMFGMILTSCVVQAQVIQVDSPRHDFGRITNTSKATHAFKITNAGDKDLVIANARPSCGCTSTVLGKSTLPPGESTSVEATFTPGNQGGRVEKTIQVASNDPKTPTTTLTLTADVLRDLYTEPPGGTFFDVPRSGTRDLSLRLKSDTGELKLESVDAAGVPYVIVTSRVMGTETFLDLHFEAAKLPKGETRGNGAFQVRTAKGPLQLPVMWSLVRTFSVNPDRIGMQLEAGKETRTSVRIARADGKPFKLLGAEDPKATRLGLTLTKNPEGTALELTVLMPADLTPGPHQETLRIRTDDPEEPVITVPVSLMVTAPKPPDPVKPADGPKAAALPKSAS